MKQVIITVGLGFGDEGKGAVVDSLARVYGADLVVRYCGGSQAGHNVQLPDGRRHTFSQFGAGTFATDRPRTYLGPAVVIDPPAMLREAGHLEELDIADATELLTVHPRCLVATFWHRALNQLREVSRKGKQHGSCGQGIGEARRYWLRYGNDAIFAADLADVSVLRDKLELQRQRSLLTIQRIVHRIDADFLREIDLWNRSADEEARELRESIREGVTISADIPDYETAIFEGAQGVLLDEYRGFHPHTTWSTVTTHHAWELVEQMKAETVAVVGITRAYTTRHGAGPLPTYSPELTTRLRDPGNPWNRWQGTMRCGWLDLPMLRYAAAAAGPLDGIIVNHLDQMTSGEQWICEGYRNANITISEAPSLVHQRRLTRKLERAKPMLVLATVDSIIRCVNEVAPVVMSGRGPTHEEREFLGLSFRKRRVETRRPAELVPAR